MVSISSIWFRWRLRLWFVAPLFAAWMAAASLGGGRVVADDLPSQQGLLRTLSGHWAWCVAFSPDGKTLASAGNNHLIKLWDASTGECIRTLKGHAGAVRSVAFSPGGATLVSGSDDRTVRLWDPATGENLATLNGHTAGVICVASSPYGTRITSGGAEGDNTVRLWSAPGRRQVAVLKGHTDRVWSVAFSPDGKTLASGSADKSIILWDVADRTKLAALAGHTDRVTSVKFSPDGKTLASGSMDQTIKLWDVASTSLTATLETFGRRGLPGHYSYSRPLSIAYSPDGETLACGGESGEMELFDIASRTPICIFWSMGANPDIDSIAFSPDGKLISTGAAGTIKLWDVAAIRLRGMSDVERVLAESRPPQHLGRGRAAPTVNDPTNPAVRARLKLAGPPEKVIELDLSRANLSDADLVCLKGLPNLEVLDLSDNPQLTCSGTSYLAATPKLRSLTIARTGVCLDSLLMARSLEKLDLTGFLANQRYLRALSGLPNLHELDLTNGNVQDSTLAAIERLGEIRTLRLGLETSVSDAGLAHLRELKRLEELDVSSPQITGSGLESLVGLPKLRRIDVRFSGITDDGIAHAAGLRQLESLDLSFCKITSAGLKHLQGLTNLRELNLYGTQISDAGLGALRGMRQLRKLDLGGTKITSDGVATIGQLTSLEELDLSRTKITQATRERKASPPSDDPFDSPPLPGPETAEVGSRPAFAQLKHLLRLRKLGLARIEWFDADGLDQLAGLAQLTDLDLSSDTIRAAGQKQLLTLPHLERLVATPYGLDAGQFDFRNLRGLRELDMRGGWFSALSFRPGGELPNLRRLRLTAEPESGGNAVSLGPLAQLPELRELELGSPFIGNVGILQQSGLGQVETLVLDAPKVTIDGLKFLDGWKNLKELTLRCQMTDAGLARVAALTDLRKLTIANTWITDAGLKKLAPLQNLRRLDITYTACTPAGVDALQRALPDCEILSGGPAPHPPWHIVLPPGTIQ